MSRIGSFLKRDSVMTLCLFVAIGILSVATLRAARDAQHSVQQVGHVQDVQNQIKDYVATSQTNSALFLKAYTSYTKCLKLIPVGPVEVVSPAIDACAVSSGLLPSK